jgi:hypothetical protein
VNAKGQTAAAYDGIPLYGTIPLSFWRSGDVVIDSELLTIHANAQPGFYTVEVGWYNPKTGARVPLGNGSDELTVETIDVTATKGLNH